MYVSKRRNNFPFFIIIIFLLTVFCIFLFVKVIMLEKKINMLAEERIIWKEKLRTDYEKELESIRLSIQESVLEYIDGDDSAFDNPVIKNDVFYGAYTENDARVALEEGRKVVYLTFDDGPSANTGRILDILAKYDIKATFFTVGKEDEASKRLYNRIVDEGHSIGMHSFSHEYNKIYSNLDSFEEDFNNIYNYIREVTGKECTLFRFPGGSSNSVNINLKKSIIEFLDEKNIRYFDWNVSTRDAEGGVLSTDVIVDNFFKGIEKKDLCMVLMHDADNLTTTVDALSVIIERLIEMDAVFLPITDNTPLIQHTIDN